MASYGTHVDVLELKLVDQRQQVLCFVDLPSDEVTADSQESRRRRCP